MQWLNYNHLLYFWTVVQEGGVTAASVRLGLAQPTVSAQIRKLEEAMGHRLFVRSGRKLELTEFGEMVRGYAEEIFSAGNELMAAVAQEPAKRALKCVVGVDDVVPKLVIHELLEPLFDMEGPEVKLRVEEGKVARLLADLAVYELDLVLSDRPIPSTVKVKAFNHLLGSCEVGFFATRKLAQKYRKGFPESLRDAPLLMPTSNTEMRGGLESWMEARSLPFRTVAEFEDSALMKVFGQHGRGLFVAPMVIRREVERTYAVEFVGVAEGLVERFYAISLERRVTHPAVARICSASRAKLFAEPSGRSPHR